MYASSICASQLRVSPIGSDAVNKDPDYSAAYCILETDTDLQGHALTFTLGRGTELCVSAIEYLSRFVRNRTLESITADLNGFYLQLTGDMQFRWLGPEKGVIHLACGALINAVWDLYAKAEGKPVWRLLAEMTPEQIVAAIDFHYIADAISPREALDILRAGKHQQAERLAILEARGYPAYTTSAGWFGFSDEKIRQLCREGLADGWTHFKLKVGGDPDEDLRRGQLMREEIGSNCHMMLDANQKWGVEEAIDRTLQLGQLKPWWMEEPTSPDDILGHARIRREVNLTYDILIHQRQLIEATRFVDQHPYQRFVLDHAAKPRLSKGELEPWTTHLRELARRPNVSCKISGLVTEANWQHWTLESLRPYLDVCVEAFGSNRLLAGSDWPVCLIASTYSQWWDLLTLYFADFSEDEVRGIFGWNAIEFYRLAADLEVSS